MSGFVALLFSLPVVFLFIHNEMAEYDTGSKIIVFIAFLMFMILYGAIAGC